MKYTREIEINVGNNVGNNVDCLTPDGWLQGVVREVSETTVTVFVELYEVEQSFTPDCIRR